MRKRFNRQKNPMRNGSPLLPSELVKQVMMDYPESNAIQQLPSPENNAKCRLVGFLNEKNKECSVVYILERNIWIRRDDRKKELTKT